MQWRPGRRVLGIEVRASLFVLVVAVNHSDNPHNKAWFLEGVLLVANNTDTNDKDYTGSGCMFNSVDELSETHFFLATVGEYVRFV